MAMPLQYETFVWEGQIDRDKESDLKLKLNQLGAEGWELISITPQVTISSLGGGTQRNILVFKKPK